MKPEDVEKLAALSRIEISREEKNNFLKDFEKILDYVGEIKKAVAEESPREAGELRNVMRPDEVRQGPVSSREELVSSFPDREGDYAKVKQIFND